MGKASQRKAARRAGIVEETPKESYRRAVKADRRGRRIDPTLEGFAKAASFGHDRVAEALIARHNLRMERVQRDHDAHKVYVLSALAPVAPMYINLVRAGVDTKRPPSSMAGGWTEHMTWGLDSAVAAVRLLLCGQLVGAAAVVRNQLERWVLHRAHNADLVQEKGESIADFVARAWSIPERFHEDWFPDGSPESDIGAAAAGEAHDTDGPVGSVTEDRDHAHVFTSDGRVLCPGRTYSGLSELLHARLSAGALRWDAVGLLRGDAWSEDVAETVDLVVAGVTLCLRQIRAGVAWKALRDGRPDVAAGLRTLLDSFSLAGERDGRFETALLGYFKSAGVSLPAEFESNDERRRPPSYTEIIDVYSVAPTFPPLMSLAPLVPHEGLSEQARDWAAHAAAAFEAVTRGDRPAGRLYNDAELTVYAFGWQRHRAIMCATQSMVNERELLGDAFNADGLNGRAQSWVILTEATSLAATWMKPGPASDAAALIGSGLRSTYWLWLEDDSRSMAVLRCVLEQTARMRTWRTKPGKAAKLETAAATRPRDWLEAAGWRRLTALNRALGEFAHTKPGSRWSGAHELLSRLQVDADPERAIYTARGAAIDFVAALAAAEVLAVTADLSPKVHASLVSLFVDAHVPAADPADGDSDAAFNHIWAQRTFDLGESDFRPMSVRKAASPGSAFGL